MDERSQLAVLPSIDHLLNLLETKKLIDEFSRELVKSFFQEELNSLRRELVDSGKSLSLTRDKWSHILLDRVQFALSQQFAPSIRPVINATGVILHTGLGRAILPDAAQENVRQIMKGYCNLELNLEDGNRGERTDHVEQLLCRLSGAEAACVVNNNAAAVFLSLNALAFGKEAIVSRGQLIEIGGSFRLPDVMDKSGVIRVEVGTTNKTKLMDYERAITPTTGVIVVAHSSNYRVLGFTEEVAIQELTDLAHSKGLPLIHDLGGGVVVDLTQFGLPYEPLVQDSLTAGVDVVTFSGDKVLGGPQSGIIVGKKQYIDQICTNPIMRVVRCCKLTYSALEATLKLFFHKKTLLKNHHTLRMLTESENKVKKRAEKLTESIANKVKVDITIEKSSAQTGSGALPLESIPSHAVTLKPKYITVEKLAAKLRDADPPVVGYLKNEKVYLDMRTVAEDEVEVLAELILRVLQFKN
jgi:L-seryl-tRNA(Ser) seleniumtransferase